MMNKILLSLILALFYFLNGLALAAERPVVILLSDSTPAYQVPLQAYKNKIKTKTIIYNLKGNVSAAPKLMQEIMQLKPTLIFALGAKAAYFAKAATTTQPDTAVLFAMVLNYNRYSLLQGQQNVAGIATDIAPGTQLFNLSLVSPTVKRIGVIYNPAFSNQTIQKAQATAKILGLELVTQSVKRNKEFKRAWLKMSNKVDAYWVLNDPLIYTLENIHWVKDQCLKSRRLCMGQSDNITRLGVLLSVNPDFASIGDQAASLSKEILSGRVTPKSIGIKAPIGTRLTINATTARKIGLNINKSAMAIVSDIIEE